MSRETLTDGYVQLMADLYDPQLISRASMTFTLSASSALNVAGGGTPRITLGSGASANCNASHKRWAHAPASVAGAGEAITRGLSKAVCACTMSPPRSAGGASAATARCRPEPYLV